MNADFIRRYADKMSQELGHPVSPTEAEAEIGLIILRVARTYGRTFRFGSYEAEDIIQEASSFAIECLAKGKYDFSRPLENYLHTHVKRRLHNFKRDRFMRPEAPCEYCDQWNPGPTPCPRWMAWEKRNRAKQALASKGPACEGNDRQGPREADSDTREIDDWVDETWPAALRADYVRLKQGVRLPTERLNAVKARVLARFSEAEAHAD